MTRIQLILIRLLLLALVLGAWETLLLNYTVDVANANVPPGAPTVTPQAWAMRRSSGDREAGMSGRR